MLLVDFARDVSLVPLSYIATDIAVANADVYR